MTRTLLTGATGRLGEPLRSRLVETGRAVRAASRSPPEQDDTVEWVELDLIDGTGIEAAVEDVEVVIHAASAPMGDTEAVDVEGTERLAAAAADAGVSNFVYVSIVGIDDIPYSYYEQKLAAERVVEDSAVPETILRATQFHGFVAEMLGMVGRLPVWPLPRGWQIQPVDVGTVSEALVEHATPEAAGRVPEVGGPEVREVGDLATAYREARGLRRPIVRLPWPGSTSKAFRAGHATCPDRAVGSVGFEAWLADQYGTAVGTTGRSAGSPSAASTDPES